MERFNNIWRNSILFLKPAMPEPTEGNISKGMFLKLHTVKIYRGRSSAHAARSSIIQGEYAMKKRTLIFCVLLCCFISGPFSLSGQQINDFMVNENASLNGSEQEFPYIAGNGKGRYVLAWPDKRSGAGQDIYAQFLNSDGSFVGENFKVNESADFAARSDVSVAMAPDGAFMIVWLDRRTGEWNVYGKLFSGSGNPMGTEFQINEETFDEEQEDPEVSVDSSGNYVVIWSDLKNGNWDIYGQRFSSEGTLIGDNFRINDDSGDALQYWPR